MKTKQEVSVLGRTAKEAIDAWEKAKVEEERLLKIAQKAKEDFINALADMVSANLERGS